jgi:3-oxoacyl-(acyl-carrier-protein) synthase
MVMISSGPTATVEPLDGIAVGGIGVVSPAGWGISALRSVLTARQLVPAIELPRPGWNTAIHVRRVPPSPARFPFLAHARLRRTSAVTHYSVAAALEALGSAADEVNKGTLRLGIVLCVMSGCVNYSRRFYSEALHDPATASPLVFPETVFNAPASHLAALLGTKAVNYTLVGDPGTFLQGLALGATWILQDDVDACVVIGGEEVDWLTADAYRLFHLKVTLAEGAGAIYLRRARKGTEEIKLKAITSSHNYSCGTTREQAGARMRNELLSTGRAGLLCDGMQGEERSDRPEAMVWKGWSGTRLSPKRLLGEGLAAASAWQCAAAVDSLVQRQHEAAYVSVLGCNQEAIGAHFGWEGGV